MRLYRTYHPEYLGEDNFPQEVELSDESFHHLCKVLRLKEGEEIHLVDGSGGHYVGKLTNVAKKKAFVSLESYVKADNESPLKLHLVQGISRNDRMDLTIQKAVELGVTEITPVFTERCGVNLSGDRLEKKVARWREIMISACLQSYRDTIPTLNQPVKLDQYLDGLVKDEEEVLINLNPFTGQRLRDLPLKAKASLLIGSEGGLSDAEIAKAQAKGYQDYNLGPRVLRTETAGLSALAIIQGTLGDL